MHICMDEINLAIAAVKGPYALDTADQTKDRTMRKDWVIAVDKGWLLWKYVLFCNGEPVVYGIAFSERGARAKARNRRDRIVMRQHDARMKAEKRRQEIIRKTVV